MNVLSGKREINIMGKNQLERILVIDRILRDRGGCSKNELVERFEVSEKSVERDFMYMRDRLNAPLDYDRLKDLYFYSDPSYFLPAVSMSEGEVWALAMSGEILNHFNAVDSFQELKDSFARLASYLPETVRVDLSQLNNRVSVITDKQTTLCDKVWKTLMDCVRENKRIRVSYRKPGAREAESRDLEPYYLVAFRGGWYIIARNPARDRIETYALARMSRPEKLKESFLLPEDFRLEEHIDPEWGIYSRTERFDFILRFQADLAPFLREKIWQKDQVLEEQEDGSVVLRFASSQLEAVEQWVLSWGTGVEVLSPPELVRKMKETAAGLSSLYV